MNRTLSIKEFFLRLAARAKENLKLTEDRDTSPKAFYEENWKPGVYMPANARPSRCRTRRPNKEKAARRAKYRRIHKQKIR